jgi:hypothetical protein
MMRIGTSYFVSRDAAIRYYKRYGEDEHGVASKLFNGEIHLGEPPLKPGETLNVIDDGTRYEIVVE